MNKKERRFLVSSFASLFHYWKVLIDIDQIFIQAHNVVFACWVGPCREAVKFSRSICQRVLMMQWFRDNFWVKSFFSWSTKDKYELTGRGAAQAQGTAWTGKAWGVRVKSTHSQRRGRVDWDPSLHPLNTTGVVYFSHWVLQILLFSMLWNNWEV